MTKRFALLFVTLSVTAVTLGAQAQPQPPQQPPITFRAEINYVEVDARVLDQQGKFITGLKPEDFQVFEDGKPQKVSAFSLVNIPLERAERPLFASKPIESDVRNNMQAADGRIYVIMLDDLHTSALRSPRVKLAAKQFIERYVGANDLAAVVHTSGRSDYSQEFTTSQSRLLRAVDGFMGRKLTSSTLNRIDDVNRRAGTPFAVSSTDPAVDIDDKERGYQARNTLMSIKNVAEYLGNIRGRRKAVVLFGEGIDYDINQMFSDQITEAQSVLDATRDTVAAATRANVAIYGVDPRGLGAEFADNASIQSFPDDTSLGLGMSSIFNEVRLAQDSLRVLGDETGGFAAVNRNDFRDAFQRIVDDNSSYYVMGYYSTNDRRDGRFRKIEVRVNRPGLTVRARKGYVAPRGKAPEAPKTTAGPNTPSQELKDAMDSPLPLTGLPLAITAAVFKGPAPKGSVVISTFVAGSMLPFVDNAGMMKNDIELLGVATDDKGKQFATDRATVNLNMKPDTAKRVTATGLRLIQTLDLNPGKYTLRVAVREANTRKAGSITFDLEVPDFSKAPLSMSDIALTSALSGVAPTVRPKDPLEKLLPGPLSSYREFSPTDEIALFTEVYDNVKQAHKVEITATVKAEGGQTVFQTREEHDSSELAGSAGGYGFQTRIPLKSFEPGLYVLRVEAITRIGDRPTTAREIVFRVGPMPAGAQ